MRFSLRELLLIITVAALALGWLLERLPLIQQNQYLRQQNDALKVVAEKRRERLEQVEHGYNNLARELGELHRIAGK